MSTEFIKRISISFVSTINIGFFLSLFLALLPSTMISDFGLIFYGILFVCCYLLYSYLPDEKQSDVNNSDEGSEDIKKTNNEINN